MLAAANAAATKSPMSRCFLSTGFGCSRRLRQLPERRRGGTSAAPSRSRAELAALVERAVDLGGLGRLGRLPRHPVAVGVVLALALRRWAKRPAHTFTVTTIALTVLSFFGPVTTGHTTMATRLVLALTHVVAAAIVIPAMARTLPSRRTKA